MKLVSIVIPVYNCEKYLEECIKSLIRQTYSDIEMIFINDGSSDKSEDIILKYKKIDKRIIYKYINNAGVSNARNIGIELAKSEYIVFVDSDDIAEDNMVELMIQHIDSADFIMAGYKVWKMKEEKEDEYKCPLFDGNIVCFCDEIIKYLSPPYLLGPCFKMFKTKIIKQYDVKYPLDISYGEDAEFVLSYLEHVESICCLNDIVYTYRKCSNESLSSKFRSDKIDIYNRITDHIIKLLSKNSSNVCIDDVEKRFIQNYVEYSHELFDSSNSYRIKRKLFFEKGYKYNILQMAKVHSKLSVAQLLVCLALKSHIFIVFYLIFRIRDGMKKILKMKSV